MTPKEFQKARQEADLSVSQLARYLGISKNQVRSIERGTRVPTIQDLSILHKLHETARPAPYTGIKERDSLPSEGDRSLYFHSSQNTQRGASERRGNSFGFSILRGGSDGMEGDSGGE